MREVPLYQTMPHLDSLEPASSAVGTLSWFSLDPNDPARPLVLPG